MSKDTFRDPPAEQPEAGKTERAEKTIRRRSSFWQILLLVVVLAILLLAVCIKLFPNVFDFDRLTRTFRYMGLRDQEGYGTISFDPNAAKDFACLGDGLLIGSDNSLTLSGLDGEQRAFVQGSMPNPILSCGEKTGLCYSPGGTYLALISSSGELLLEQTTSGAYLDARLSPDGYLSYLTTESGCKSVCTLINPKQEVVFRFSSRTRYLNVCGVPEGGKLLAVASLGEQNGAYRSELILLETDRVVEDLEQDPSVIRADLGNQVIYDLVFLDRSHICAVGEDDIRFLNTEGELLNRISLTEHALLDYCFCQDRVVLALGQGSAGESGELLLLNAEGETQAHREYRERIRSVSAAGKYNGVLTEARLEILDGKLEICHRREETADADTVVLRPDGTAFLIGTNNAELFIPN